MSRRYAPVGEREHALEVLRERRSRPRPRPAPSPRRRARATSAREPRELGELRLRPAVARRSARSGARRGGGGTDPRGGGRRSRSCSRRASLAPRRAAWCAAPGGSSRRRARRTRSRELTPNSSSTTGLPKPPASSQVKAARQELAHLVVLHRVDVRPDEVDERRERAQRVAVVARRSTSMPQAPSPSEIGCVAPPARTACTIEPRPGGDLLDGGRAAVERHLVGDEPAGDRRVRAEAARDLARRTRPAARRARRRGRGRGRCARPGPSSRRTCGRRGTSGSCRARARRGRRGSRRSGRAPRRRALRLPARSRARSRTSGSMLSPCSARTASSSRTTAAS